MFEAINRLPIDTNWPKNLQYDLVEANNGLHEIQCSGYEAIQLYNPMNTQAGIPLAYFSFADLRSDIWDDVGGADWERRLISEESMASLFNPGGSLDISTFWKRCQSKFLKQYGPPFHPYDTFTLEDIAREARSMSVAIKCYSVIREPTSRNTEDVRVFFSTLINNNLVMDVRSFSQNGFTGSGVGRRIDKEDLASDERLKRMCRGYIADRIADSPYGTRNNIGLAPIVSETVWTTKFTYGCLLTAMWMQLLDAMLNNQPIRFCEHGNCGKMFAAARKDKRYCSQSCRDNAKSLRNYFKKKVEKGGTE